MHNPSSERQDIDHFDHEDQYGTFRDQIRCITNKYEHLLLQYHLI
jgi:hypothetical protein